MSKCNCTPVSPCDCENVSSLRGKSAYEIWVLQQGPNDDTSLEAFMEYMKGGKGDKGDKGDTGDPGPVATVEGIAPVNRNVTLSRPAQMYLGGAGTITPICKKLQNETLYIHVDGAAIVTVDLANWAVSELLPQYNLRLVMGTNNSFTARIKAANNLWTPTGSYVSSYDIPISGRGLQIYDIFNSVGSGPIIVKKFPQS